jgi:hypothetical protein
MRSNGTDFMNWYFEKDGISQGPLSEAELEALVRHGTVAAAHLIWQVGTENWDSVQVLRPQWVPSTINVVPPTREPEQGKAAKPKRERAASTAKPTTSRLKSSPAKPEAEKSAAQPARKTSILRRLFGKK